MRILALNPYAAGSHRAFFDGWAARSRHEWTIVDLPGWNWKWRMRYAAVELADHVRELIDAGKGGWDAVVCTDMMNAAEWRGLAPAGVGRLPLVVYFHENQASYPSAGSRGGPDPRDVHFVLTNMASAIAADEAWFNSAYNLETFVDGLRAALRVAPGIDAPAIGERVAARARVEPPGVDDALFDAERNASGRGSDGPLRVLWAARWEFDKRPDIFAAAMQTLHAQNAEFIVDVVGARENHETGDSRREKGAAAFEAMRARLGDRVERFGRAKSREQYVHALVEADVIVSTAAHEFFGLAVVEAVATGAMAIVPRALAYPEVLGEGPWVAYHDESVEGVAQAVSVAGEHLARTGRATGGDIGAGRAHVGRYRWSARAAAMDDRLEHVASRAPRPDP